MSHVNLMTDTIISSLPPSALRSILRSMLSADPSITPTFESRAREYLAISINRGESSTNDVGVLRAMLGSGMVWDVVELLTKGVDGVVDGDVIQAITAVQKTMLLRGLTDEKRRGLEGLLKALEGREGFERSLEALRGMLGLQSSKEDAKAFQTPPLSPSIETFELNGKQLPRLFSGLWQLSSPSWGTASTQSIQTQFQSYASQGFTAYDMADHYGDAEILFGKFRNSCSNPDAIFGATKYCIFTPTDVTRDVVAANVSERCSRMGSNHVDLLQFHWHNYQDPQYLDALRYLQEDDRVQALGLCNFDTEHMSCILSAGIQIRTNQVQFSLIDSRPIHKMAAVCKEHDIKLLTYGTLCGGFIADKWLGQPEPELFLESVTPSQRKYYEMIVNWGGWTLFQELLAVLRDIANKHKVAISNVATRWVLDFPYVGAVIVGTRMGVSGHAEENLATYGWSLDMNDQAAIEAVLARSRRDQMVELLGDCGGEYR